MSYLGRGGEWNNRSERKGYEEEEERVGQGNPRKKRKKTRRN